MPPYCSKPTKTKRLRQEHQKDRHNRNRCNRGPRGSRLQGSTPATGVNTTKTPARNNCGCNQPACREDKDMSQTTCYNYKNKGHFANQCLELCKPKN